MFNSERASDGDAPRATADVKPLAPDDALDQVLVEGLVSVINAAYAVGEAGFWREGWTRTNPDEIAEAIRTGGMLAATLDDRLVGCAYVRPLDARTGDLGLVSGLANRWGSGIGGELVRSAEALTRSRGTSTMQLELLVPVGWTHPEKVKLRSWYTRLGYEEVRTAPFEEVAAHLAPQLAAPSEFLIFRKRLA
jgi:GNAT superfamily N-acetyltransferase